MRAAIWVFSLKQFSQNLFVICWVNVVWFFEIFLPGYCEENFSDSSPRTNSFSIWIFPLKMAINHKWLNLRHLCRIIYDQSFTFSSRDSLFRRVLCWYWGLIKFKFKLNFSQLFNLLLSPITIWGFSTSSIAEFIKLFSP